MDEKPKVDKSAESTPEDRGEHSVAVPPQGIATFYADPKAKPVAYVKALRKADVKVFGADDVDLALRLLGDSDPTLTRTLSLAGVGRSLDVIDQWVNRVVLTRLQAVIPEATAKLAPNAGDTLAAILDVLAPALSETNRQVRLRAQNLVRLCLIWLFRRRDLDPVEALQVLAAKWKDSARNKPKLPKRAGQNLLARSKPAQLQSLLLIADLHRTEVEAANSALREAQRAQAVLRDSLTERDRELAERETALAEATHKLRESEASLEAERVSVQKQKELRELDAQEAQGRLRQFIGDKLDPFIADAREALEFDPPRIKSAKQTLDLVRATIAGEVKKGNA